MADLRISDAPLLTQDKITGAIKVPTGGNGNYSIQLSDLAWYVVNKENLTDVVYVDTAVSNVSVMLQAHIADKSNPHQVTKAQVGLDQVNNTADLDKPVSNATQSAIITATQNKANKATTLSGYGITDAYTKSEIDELVGYEIKYVHDHYTLSDDDFDGFMIVLVDAPLTANVTVPTVGDTIPIGRAVNIGQETINQVKIVPSDGVTINPLDACEFRRDGSFATLIYEGNDKWRFIGELP